MKRIGALLALLIGVSFSAGAVTYDLWDLVNVPGTTGNAGNFWLIGDKTFQFTFAEYSGTGVFTPGSPLSHGAFDVTDAIEGNFYGFRISGSMTASADSFNPPGSTSSTADLRLGYTVTTPTPLMTDLHLVLTGGCVVTNQGSCAIIANEDATNNALENLGHLQASITAPPLTVNSPVSLDFPSLQSEVRILKDIQLIVHTGSTGVSTADATLSITSQFISQVPEPGFYGALALGVSGLLFMRRRRKV